VSVVGETIYCRGVWDTLIHGHLCCMVPWKDPYAVSYVTVLSRNDIVEMFPSVLSFRMG